MTHGDGQSAAIIDCCKSLYISFVIRKRQLAKGSGKFGMSDYFQ